jgi:hypothetical protein
LDNIYEYWDIEWKLMYAVNNLGRPPVIDIKAFNGDVGCP